MHDETNENVEIPELLIDFGDVAELTLGEGRSTNESKRFIYN